MNKELKIRVWDKTNKKMFYPKRSITPKHDIYCQHDNGPDINFYSWKQEYQEGDSDDVEYEIQQYVGVKDRNGKEIFEGDIILNDNVDETYCSPACIVRTQYEYAGWSLAYKLKPNDSDGSGLFEELKHIINGVELYEEFQVLLAGQSYEIIGNIYETPNLIER